MAMTRDGTFSLANYTFPLANGSEWQVLTSHSNGQLSWEDWAAGGSSDIESIHVSVNSGQILSMFSSPIELLPAPGAGKVIEVINILVKKNFVSSPYAGDIYPGIIFSGAPSLFDNIAGLSIDFTSSQINTIPANGIVVENAPLLLHTSSSDPTGGDGSLDIYIHYRIVDL